MQNKEKPESKWKRIPPTPERRALAARLKVLRQMNGWKQEDAARELGWTLNSYGDIELCRKRVHTDQLLELAQVFEVTPSWLLTGSTKDLSDAAKRRIQNDVFFNLSQQRGSKE
tara:strand:- start:66 stop:407 length:342 start_codon:yes stop_codon:yes gene_type:complete